MFFTYIKANNCKRKSIFNEYTWTRNILKLNLYKNVIEVLFERYEITKDKVNLLLLI